MNRQIERCQHHYPRKDAFCDAWSSWVVWASTTDAPVGVGACDRHLAERVRWVGEDARRVEVARLHIFHEDFSTPD